MELCYDLEKGLLFKDGEECCICQGEPFFGVKSGELGTHFACTNFLCTLVGAMSISDKGIITKIKVFPEIEIKDGVTIDNTCIEYWNETLIHKTTWMNLARGFNIMHKYKEIAPDFVELFTVNTGHSCRGLNPKYLPSPSTFNPKLTESDMEIVKKVLAQGPPKELEEARKRK